MNVASRKYSISQQYLFFVFFAPLVLLIISVIAAWSIYYGNLKEKNIFYAEEADKIIKILDTGFQYIEQFSKIIGNQIAVLDKVDAQAVGLVLKNNIATASIIQDVFNVNLFDFTNPDGYVIASTVEGAIAHPPMVFKEQRKWVTLAPKEPWKLHISDFSLSILKSKNHTEPSLIIPAGYGITDKTGKFLGTISTGYEIDTLNHNIKLAFSANDTNFVLLSADNKIITQTDDHLKFNDVIVDKKIDSVRQNSQIQGELPERIAYGNSTYSFFKKAPKYDYLILIGESNVALQKEFRSSVFPEMIQSIVTGIFLLLLLYFFRSKIVNPILTLSIAADYISKGETNITIPEGNSLEIDNLSKQLKKVVNYTEELLESQSALKEAHVKVTERTLELEKALKAKTEFLNNMSHEIKTPVHGVINFADMLVNEWKTMPDEVRLDYATKIQKNSDRLYSLVANLLDLSQLGANKMQFMMEKQDLVRLVHEVIEEIEPLYLGKKKLYISLKFDDSLDTNALFDRERITQVVRNLFSNAIKFTPFGNITANIYTRKITYEDGTVVDGLALTVKDEGVGVPINELYEIFDAFSQSSRTKTMAGGTGLGLSICYEIIAMHKGVIWAENNKNEKGASFTFVLPYS